MCHNELDGIIMLQCFVSFSTTCFHFIFKLCKCIRNTVFPLEEFHISAQKIAEGCVKYRNPVQFRTWNLYLIQTLAKLLYAN